MSSWTQDVRYGLRMLGKAPGFTAVAIITLALGIGANTAIFSVANAVLLRPLPFADPGRLVQVTRAPAGEPSQFNPLSWLRYTLIHDRNKSFSGIAAATNETFNLSGLGDPEQIASARVSGEFFDVLGVRPAIGRNFLNDEDQAGGKNVVLISHSFWIRKMAGAADVLGRHLTLDSRDYEIVGVLPSAFQFELLGPNIDLWAPRVFDLNLITPQQVQGGTGFLTAIARRRSGLTLAQAQAEMNVLDRQYRQSDPGRPDVDPRLVVNVADLKDQFVANIRPALLLLTAAVGLLLLITCSNVASLLLSRAVSRKKELALRAAIGASRAAIVRQLLVESTLLALLGGAAGALLAAWSNSLLVRFASDSAVALGEARLDFPVLAFTALISVASGVLFGLLPAIQGSRTDLNTVLREEGRGHSGTRRRNLVRSLLVSGQVALSMILLIGSSLLIRSFLRLQSSNPGFDATNVLTMRIELPPARYGKREQMVAFYKQAIQLSGALPGVQAAAISSALPLNTMRVSPVLFEGQPELPLGQRPFVNIQAISPDYLRVLRIPLLRGREFIDHDGPESSRVVMVNETLARRFWPNQDPIGKKVWPGRSPVAVVVGVMADIKNASLAADPSPEVFLPFPQLPWAHLNLSLRASTDPAGLIPAVRREIAAIDKDQAVTGAQTLDQVVATSAAQRRSTMLLLGSFAATAFILAMVGIYGLVAYSVAQRSGELGIRIALGAARGDNLRLVVGQGLALTLSGIIVGVACSVGLTRLLSGMLYHTSATDPATFVLCAILFTAVALAASYVPARRALRIDPTEALRSE